MIPRNLGGLRAAARPLPLLALAAALLLPTGGRLAAQQLVVHGLPDTVQLRVDRLLAEDAYTLIDRDSTLGPEFLAYGDLVVVDAEVRLEGEVRGDVVVLGGAFYLRPGATVRGTVLVIGGLFLPSGLASHGGVWEVPGELTRLDGSLELGFTAAFDEAPAERPLPRIVFPGMYGVGIPAYQRVDALILRWGVQWRPSGTTAGPVVSGGVTYSTARRALGGGVEVEVPVGQGMRLGMVAERATRTHDLWIRGDLANSLLHLWGGGDPRNYHESDRVELALERTLPALTLRGWTTGPFLRLELSDDRSLTAVDTWSVIGRGPRRPNPPVFEGRLATVTAGSRVRWSGASSRFEGLLSLEQGIDAEPLGEREFTQWTTAAGVWLEALLGHTITVRSRAMGTLGGIEAPRQRWSHLGGGGTMPTLPEAALDGDNLLFVDSRYHAPLPFLGLGSLGAPELVLVHQAGAAWVTGVPPTLEQAVGAGVRLLAVAAMVYADPARGWPSRVFVVELSLPGSF